MTKQWDFFVEWPLVICAVKHILLTTVQVERLAVSHWKEGDRSCNSIIHFNDNFEGLLGSAPSPQGFFYLQSCDFFFFFFG